MVVLLHLGRVCHKWELLTRVLEIEGANARNLGMFYLAVVKSVSLYGL